MSDDLPERPLLGLLLRLLGQHYNQDVHEALRARGFGDIRPPHANVFVFVPPEGIAMSELARLARVRRQSMAQAVRELVDAGYAELRDNPRDRRSKLVFLTERGQAVGPVTATAGERVEERWARLVGRDELESLREAMSRILDALRGIEGTAAAKLPDRLSPEPRETAAAWWHPPARETSQPMTAETREPTPPPARNGIRRLASPVGTVRGR